MLKTNSKKAKENIQKYIMEHFDYSNYEEEGKEPPKTYKEVCKCIYDTMIDEKFYSRERSSYDTFRSWCMGLPSLLDTCYYYNRSAIEDLKIILEQTDGVATRYEESKAEEVLTYLLYREITNNM